MEFFQRESAGLAEFDDFPLFAVHPSRYSGNLLRDLDRNGLHSVPVAMQQVSWPHLHMAHLDRTSEIEYVCEGVGNREVSRKHLKLEFPGCFDVADRAICHHAKAIQDAQDVGM